jgi:hypothetical protein
VDGEMTNVVALDTVKTPNATLVRMLEELLELAKSGEIEGGIFAGAGLDGCIHTCWNCGAAARSQLLGAVEKVKFDFIWQEYERRD